MFAVNNFTLLYGRYSAGDVNCADGSVALASPSAAAAGVKDESDSGQVTFLLVLILQQLNFSK